MTKPPSRVPVVFLAAVGGLGCLGLACTAGMVAVGVAAIEDTREEEARTRRAMAMGEELRRREEEEANRPDPLDEDGPVPASDLPVVDRDVPTHDVSLVATCPADEREVVQDAIADAIDVGAPLYNDGDFAGCYAQYERTARRLEQVLPARCAGISRALAAGRARAATRSTDAEKAWAMRDAFDGILDVLGRAR